MADTVTITGGLEVAAAIARVPEDVKAKYMPEFKNVADGVLVDAQDRCPYGVNHKGPEPHLRDTGRVEAVEDGYNITFGDETGEIGYTFFVEVGHRTRSGSMVPAQPYLMPSFIQGSEELMQMLEGILP